MNVFIFDLYICVCKVVVSQEINYLYMYLSIICLVKKLENHIPGDLKSWETVTEISGNHSRVEDIILTIEKLNIQKSKK